MTKFKYVENQCTRKTLQKNKSMPGLEQHGADLGKQKVILQDIQFPISQKKKKRKKKEQGNGPTRLTNNDLWPPDMVS